MQISNLETKAKSKDITLISLLRALESHLPMAISCYFIKAFRSHIIFLCLIQFFYVTQRQKY